MSKIRIHIRNNHWKEGFLPCDLEGEKHSTITKGAAGYLHGVINKMSTKESLNKGTELSAKIIQKIGARI